jgi:hypothetical protein
MNLSTPDNHHSIARHGSVRNRIVEPRYNLESAEYAAIYRRVWPTAARILWALCVPPGERGLRKYRIATEVDGIKGNSERREVDQRYMGKKTSGKWREA